MYTLKIVCTYVHTGPILGHFDHLSSNAYCRHSTQPESDSALETIHLVSILSTLYHIWPIKRRVHGWCTVQVSVYICTHYGSGAGLDTMCCEIEMTGS